MTQARWEYGVSRPGGCCFSSSLEFGLRVGGIFLRTRLLPSLLAGLLVSWSILTSDVVAQPAGEGPRAKVIELDELEWLVGVWRHLPGEEFEFEQHWSAPVDEAMMGMFRLVSEEKIVVYEFLLIERLPEGIFLRIRHYRPGMLDVDRFPFRLKLIQQGPRELVFENPDGQRPKRITYRRPGAGRLDILVESIEDDKSSIIELRFQQPTITRRESGILRR